MARALSDQTDCRFCRAHVASRHGQKRQPFPLFRQRAGGDPAGGHAVRRDPLSLRNVEDILAERGIDICHETVRLWWNRLGPIFAAEIRRKRVHSMRAYTHWQWHLDEDYVKINGEMHYLWRAPLHKGEVLKSFVTKARDKAEALQFINKTMKRHGRSKAVLTDDRRSYRAAMKEIGNAGIQEVGPEQNQATEIVDPDTGEITPT